MVWVKAGAVIGLLWLVFRPTVTADGQPCPSGTKAFLTLSGASLCFPVEPSIGLTVVKTTSECDPTSPIYDPARCSASAGPVTIPQDNPAGTQLTL